MLDNVCYHSLQSLLSSCLLSKISKIKIYKTTGKADFLYGFEGWIEGGNNKKCGVSS